MVERQSESAANNDPAIVAEATLGNAAKTAVGFDGDGAVALDKLDYLADLILELQQMAVDFGHERLARQLAMAYTEAAQSRRRMQPAV